MLFGFLVGRWWAPLVPLLLGLIVSHSAYEGYEGGDTLAFLPFLWGAFLAVGVLVGVILRKLRGKSSDRPSYPPS